MAQKKAVVLGGTGLLGFATIQELVKRGYDVFSVALELPDENLFAGLEDNVHSCLLYTSDAADE